VTAPRLVQLVARYSLLAIAVVLLNFLLPRLLPGDPLDFSAEGEKQAGVPLTGAAKEQLRGYYHLDEPLVSQLRAYLGDLAHGDLGWSIASPASVRTLITSRLPWTLGLVLTAIGISAMVGTALGMMAGWFPARMRDGILLGTTVALAAIPEFLIAIGLLLLFAIKLRWFPLLGGRTPFAEYGGGAAGLGRQTLDIARHLTLPAIALVIANGAGFFLIARDATVTVHREAWLTLARAKGLREWQVALRHALPNIAPPLATFFALRLGGILGGALVVERVFGVPGLGSLAYQSIAARDYPVLQALFLLASLAVLAANFAVELLYARRLGVDHG